MPRIGKSVETESTLASVMGWGVGGVTDGYRVSF